MNYDKLLEALHKEANSNKKNVNKFKENTLLNIEVISQNCFTQKGVFTVLITLYIYKIIHPTQDIRLHQSGLVGGFSGRSIDTKYITPTLKSLGLPSMAESGWLTRSLEQPYPYTLDYQGKISNKHVKQAFLELVHSIEVDNINPKNILVELFQQVMGIEKENIVEIEPLANPDRLTINKMVELLDKQFKNTYKTFGASKLPVIAFHSMYQLILNEITRYNKCTLKDLGSHTASDRSTKSAGDIEVFEQDTLFEAIEIKLDKSIDSNMLLIAKEKIIRHNPKRYYILSYVGIQTEDSENIQSIINEIKDNHGCQIIVNGVMDTLKYYMRLIENLDDFYAIYSNAIIIDTELQTVHKEFWNTLTKEFNNEI